MSRGGDKARRPPRPARHGVERTLYHGGANLRAGAVRARFVPRRGRARALARAAWVTLALVAAGAAVYGGWRARAPLGRWLARLDVGRASVAVSGLTYLSRAEVLRAAGLRDAESLLRVDVVRARARLLRHPRVGAARVERRLDGRVHVEVGERVPVALVDAGRPSEVDAEGRVLPPLVRGVLPDLPVVSGLSRPARGWVRDPDLARALRWLRALGGAEVGLAGRVSQVDVGERDHTLVVLAPEGVRVLLPPEPEEPEQLSALRIVLADLAAKGQAALTIDCRARGQAVVRTVDRPDPPPGGAGERSGEPGTAADGRTITQT